MEICPITRDEIINGYSLLNCNHIYEKESIKEWIAHNISYSMYPLCPLCRKYINIYDIVRLHIFDVFSLILKKTNILLWFVFLHPCVFMSLFIKSHQ